MTSQTADSRLLLAGPLRLTAGLVLAVAAMAVFLRIAGAEGLAEAAASLPRQPLPVLAAAAAYTGAFWLRAVAWRLLLGQDIAVARLFSILQASLFLNHLLPVKAGEVARPLLLTRHGLTWTDATASTIVARMLDMAALLVIAAAALAFAGGSHGHWLALAGVAVLIGLLVLLLAAPKGRLIALLPRPLAQPVAELQRSLACMRPFALAQAAPLVVFSWLLEAGMLYAAARLLDVDVPAALIAGATAFTVLFQVVHVTPGGIGVYETSMTSVLALGGVSAETALLLALTTHGLKFAYAFSAGLAGAVAELTGWVRGSARLPKEASRIEVFAARAWNVLNEGKPFTVVFTFVVLVLLSLPDLIRIEAWPRLALGLAAIAPLAALFFRFDFPLRLRWALWAYLAVYSLAFAAFDPLALALVVVLYLTFTVFVWGTVYYHLRIGTPWTNFLRFWRLVLENPDPTSGNFQEQVPKVLLLAFAFLHVSGAASVEALAWTLAFSAAVGLTALLLHRWFFTWVPALPQPFDGTDGRPARVSKRFIVIAIDGCRADRLREANTPVIDRLRAEGCEYTNVATVYPARTVTCFSSMLTGAPPRRHGMLSNFVPSLGVKCDSVFDALRRAGLNGKLVGIAHLIDAFGDDVRSVTAVTHNDEIDAALVARAKRVLREEEPDLLVLQLLSVDQTGHARGSYREEYLRKIEETDACIGEFLAWCHAHGYLDGATVLITADHGQGIGIGGHGHMTPTEIHVPCILWGEGVQAGVSDAEPRFITDIADTVCYYLGVERPRHSVGRPLLPSVASAGPVVYILPAYNEAESLPSVLDALWRSAPPGCEVVVVDDGSSDGTGEAARRAGAHVVRHETNRGLGAALRSGIAAARRLNARAAVYLDADGEYDPSQAGSLLEPVLRGEADYVLGSRFKGSIQGMRPVRWLGNRAFSLLLSVACGRWISDGQTGFRAFSRRALDVAEIIHDYNYAQVLTMDLLHKGMRMREVPVSYRRRSRGQSFISARYLWRVPLAMAREMLAD